MVVVSTDYLSSLTRAEHASLHQGTEVRAHLIPSHGEHGLLDAVEVDGMGDDGDESSTESSEGTESDEQNENGSHNDLQSVERTPWPRNKTGRVCVLNTMGTPVK